MGETKYYITNFSFDYDNPKNPMRYDFSSSATPDGTHQLDGGQSDPSHPKRNSYVLQDPAKIRVRLTDTSNNARNAKLSLKTVTLGFQPAGDADRKEDQVRAPFAAPGADGWEKQTDMMSQPVINYPTPYTCWQTQLLDVVNDPNGGAWELTVTAEVGFKGADGKWTGLQPFSKDPEMIVKPGGGG